MAIADEMHDCLNEILDYAIENDDIEVMKILERYGLCKPGCIDVLG